MAELSTKRLIDYLNEPGVDADILKESMIGVGLASAEQGVKADNAVQRGLALFTFLSESMALLPTSSAGLSAGSWYNNDGFPCQVQP